MEGMQRALIVSILSRGWAAALSLLAVPYYLHYLGIEAYGIVGLFASFSALVSFLDLGLGASLIRELAPLAGDAAAVARRRDTTRTFELAYVVIAVLIGFVVATGAAPIAHTWIQVDALERDAAAQAFALAGVALACQWPANLYSSGLAGVHLQAQLGVATTVFATLRVALALIALAWAPTLASFFWAQIVAAALQSLGLRWLLWRAIPLPAHRPALRGAAIRGSLRFAGGMTGITITSIVLTQADKVILSRALPLPEYGVYVVAGTLATGLYMLISPTFSVVYPRFAALLHQGDTAAVSQLFHVGSQAMAALVMPVAGVVACFAPSVLYAWTGDVLLDGAGASVLAFLILGNAFNGIMNTPYALQLAAGWTQLALWVNVVAIAVLAPALWWAAHSFGAVGAAAVWPLLNLAYIVFTPQIMHRRLLPCEKSRWYWADVLLPAAISAAVLALLNQLPLTGLSRLTTALVLFLYWLITVAATVGVLPQLRARVWHRLQSVPLPCR